MHIKQKPTPDTQREEEKLEKGASGFKWFHIIGQEGEMERKHQLDG
jgi:hypothetical protein